MAFELERDAHRLEAAKDVATTARVYPTKDGARQQATGAASYSIRTPEGVEITSGTVSDTDVTLGARTVTRFDVPIPAISTYDEGYQLRLIWDYQGSNYELILFDVVASPMGEGISFSDLQGMRPDVDQTLDRLGQILGAAAGQTAQEFATANLAQRARARLINWLDGVQRVGSGGGGESSALSNKQGSLRPWMILDRRAVSQVERYLAMELLYEGLARNHEEGDDSSSGLYRSYRTLARSEFDALRIRYDDTDDLVQDASIYAPGTVFPTRRVQS